MEKKMGNEMETGFKSPYKGIIGIRRVHSWDYSLSTLARRSYSSVL